MEHFSRCKFRNEGCPTFIVGQPSLGNRWAIFVGQPSAILGNRWAIVGQSSLGNLRQSCWATFVAQQDRLILLVVVDVVAFSVTRWRITKLAWFFKSWTKRDVFKIVFQYLRYFWSSRAFKISPIWSHWWHTFKYFGSCGGLVSGQRARLLLQTPTKSKTLLQYIIFLPGLDADNFTTYCLVRSNPNQSNNRSVVQWYFHLRSK